MAPTKNLIEYGDLDCVRAAYARIVMAVADVTKNASLKAAFSSVQREMFLPEPPWLVSNSSGIREIQSADPAVAYQDLLFVLDDEKNINNGSPSLHAWAMNKLEISAGETIVHIGIGTGYYTAILSKLAEPGGAITGVDIDKQLLDLARENLKSFTNVNIECGDGSCWPLEAADVIYVNYAVSKPPTNWFEKLKNGGRLLFPLGVPAQDEKGEFRNYTSAAAYILVERHAEVLNAKYMGSVLFVCDANISVLTKKSEIVELERSFKRGGITGICRVRLGRKTENEWYSADDWGLVADKS
jgi:protein-L-isoaspartate(D-aspartate) O-methyltransferase